MELYCDRYIRFWSYGQPSILLIPPPIETAPGAAFVGPPSGSENPLSSSQMLPRQQRATQA